MVVYLVFFPECLNWIELFAVVEVCQARELPEPDDREAASPERGDDLLHEPGAMRSAHPAVGREVDGGDAVTRGAFLDGV